MLAAPAEEIPHLDLAAVTRAEGHPDQANRILRDQVANRTDDEGPLDLSQRSHTILENLHGQNTRGLTAHPPTTHHPKRLPPGEWPLAPAPRSAVTRTERLDNVKGERSPSTTEEGAMTSAVGELSWCRVRHAPVGRTHLVEVRHAWLPSGACVAAKRRMSTQRSEGNES